MSRKMLFLCVALTCIVAWGVKGQDASLPDIITQHGRIYAGYDVNKPSELVELLKQKRVQECLELSDEQKSACVELFSKTKEISRELNRNGVTGAEHFYRHSTAAKGLATR